MSRIRRLPSGVRAGLTGLGSAPAGVIDPPPELLHHWPVAKPAADAAGWWFLGAHGGAGVSLLCHYAAIAGLPFAADAAGKWPVPDGQRPVVIVARTHGAGLTAANWAARQYLSHLAPTGTRLLGCVLVPDGPGRLPKRMVSAITSLITGMYARTWIAPWVDDYRLVSPSMPADQWPPLMPDLADIYREIRAAATDGEPNV